MFADVSTKSVKIKDNRKNIQDLTLAKIVLSVVIVSNMPKFTLPGIQI